MESPEITETIIDAVDTTNVAVIEMVIIIVVVIEVVIIEVVEVTTVVMDKVVIVVIGVKVMIIAVLKMVIIHVVTGNVVIGIGVADKTDLIMAIGEVVAKIMAEVNGKINQEMVRTDNQDKIEIIGTENGSTMNMMSRKLDRRHNKSHKKLIPIRTFLGFALCVIYFALGSMQSKQAWILN